MYGRIDEYHPEGEETWGEYIERLEHFFTANDVGQDKRKSVLLSVCGAKAYKLMCNLLAPSKPGEKTFTELVTLLKNHYNPVPSEIAQRFKFNNRQQGPEESVAEFVNQLKALSEHCNFENQLNKMLRDRLVCGIRDKTIQLQLIADNELTFETAFQKACSLEEANKNVKELQGAMANPLNSVHALQSSKDPKPCWRCGFTRHSPDECVFKDKECFTCGKVGHTKRKCRSRDKGNNRAKSDQKGRSERISTLEDEMPTPGDSSVREYDLYSVSVGQNNKVRPPIMLPVRINGHTVKMELDTGAGKSILNVDTYDKIKNTPLIPSDLLLRTYTGEAISVAGKAVVSVNYEEQFQELSVLVVNTNGPNILGRDWLALLKLNWKELFAVHSLVDSQKEGVAKIINQFQDVFEGGLGKMKGVTAKIVVQDNCKPKYFKARPVPHALREGIEKELEKSVREGTLIPVQFSDWAAPIVPLVKEDKSVRICGDYKLTVNKFSKLDNYPIPKLEDLLVALAGGEKYTKLDMSRAYNQMELDPEARKFLTINTHKGLYQPTRLVYGVSSGPGIFQRSMEELLAGIPFVIVRVDDILISGSNDQEHCKTLEEVLTRIQAAGIKLNKTKCIFMADEVMFCGQRISKAGIQPAKDKIDGLKQAETPRNVSQLRSYLGMINYYRAYLPRVSQELKPLYELLKKGQAWKWGHTENESFLKSKRMLSSSSLLVHYDSRKPLILACDASPYGVGAVLSHQMKDGTERPISFASRTLADAEKNYSQLDKEALAIIFGIRKFHQYIYGRHVTILTDHKPLVGLLGEEKPVPKVIPPRMLRWIITLSGYEYTLKYRAGDLMAHADAMSRLPSIATHIPQIPELGEMVMLLETLKTSTVGVKDIIRWTRADPVTCKVYDYCLNGWPVQLEDEVHSDLRFYYRCRNELSVENGCVLRGNRVVVPPPGRQSILQELHNSHPGICKMKAIARVMSFGLLWTRR